MGRKVVTVSLPSELYKIIEDKRWKAALTRSSFVQKAIETYIGDKDGKADESDDLGGSHSAGPVHRALSRSIAGDEDKADARLGEDKHDTTNEGEKR